MMDEQDLVKVREFRDFCVTMVEMHVGELHHMLKHPPNASMNIFAYDNAEISFDDATKKQMQQQAMQAVFEQIKRYMLKTEQDIALYERYIRICRNLTSGAYVKETE